MDAGDVDSRVIGANEQPAVYDFWFFTGDSRAPLRGTARRVFLAAADAQSLRLGENGSAAIVVTHFSSHP